LTADHLRVAVRDPMTSRAFAADLAGILGAAAPTTETTARVPEEVR
jgi:histidinol-phosphate aminotransferase